MGNVVLYSYGSILDNTHNLSFAMQNTRTLTLVVLKPKAVEGRFKTESGLNFFK